MKDYEFYAKIANVPLDKRCSCLSNDFTSPVLGMTLHQVYLEIKTIDDMTRDVLIRKNKLLEAVEKYVNDNVII